MLGPVAVILLVAFGVRLAAVLWLSDTVPFSDYFFYHLAGQKIASSWGFLFDRAQAESYGKLGWWPPLYPVFLGAVYSIFGVQHRAAVYLQVLFGTLVCWLVYRIGRRAGGERVGLVAALLVAMDPTYVFLTNLLASENLFAPLFALGLWLVGRTWKTPRGNMLAGVVFGLGALTRAVGVLVPVVASLWLRGRTPDRRAWLVASAWLLGGSALVIAPWTLRNAVVAGSPAIVCFGGGLNFYFGHNEVGIGYRDWKQTPMGALQSQRDIDRVGYELGLRYIAAHPSHLVTGSLRKIGALFGPPGYAPHDNSAIMLPDGWRTDPELGRVAEEMRARQRAKNRWLDGLFSTLAAVHTYALLGGALAACLFFWRQLPSDLRLGAYLSLYWIASHVVFWGQPRFRYPMEIPLALLAAYALVRGMHRAANPAPVGTGAPHPKRVAAARAR